MGRSRGGLTTKIHALVDANGMPIALKLTEGQAHDGRSAANMLEGVQAGQILLADRAYDSNALRESMNTRGAWANIRPMPNRVEPPVFSPFLYRYRNLVERFFNRLKHYRAIATRYDKHAANYLAPVKLASIRIWLRHYVRWTPLVGQFGGFAKLGSGSYQAASLAVSFSPAPIAAYASSGVSSPNDECGRWPL